MYISRAAVCYVALCLCFYFSATLQILVLVKIAVFKVSTQKENEKQRSFSVTADRKKYDFFLQRTHLPTMARLCSDPHAICREKEFESVKMQNACSSTENILRL